VDDSGTPQDFIGHASGNNFIIITTENKAPAMLQSLKERFAKEVATHYSFIDREQGFMLAEQDGEQVKQPLMTLSVGIVSPSRHRFADIREITELAAEARRQDN
jgi:GGDEF domain-containing protein